MENISLPTKEEMYHALEKRHTEAVQKKLSESSVTVCGLGGLGSNIAISLARIGVGKLHLIDFDRVDISNLNRQQYAADQIGLPKTEALKSNILKIAPYCELNTDFLRLTEENIPDILEGATIICEAFDVPEQKAILTNTVMEKMPGTFLVGASGMAGFESSNIMETKKITERYYLCGDRVSDNVRFSLMAPRVMLCAAHQANMVVRIIMGETEV